MAEEKQTARVLAWLNEWGSIDPLTAWVELGIYRLGARIFDLRAAGHVIETDRIEVANRFGETCRVAQYRINHNG